MTPVEKKAMKQFYANSVTYRNLLSNLSIYGREGALERYAAIVAEIAAGHSKHTVLDLGCGTGESTRRLCDKGLHAIGVDISLLLLSSSKERVDQRPTLVSADISSLPFYSGSVDCIGLHDVIEHIPDVDKLLQEIVRVLRPNGRVIIVSPNLLSPVKPVRHLLGIGGFNVSFYGSSCKAFMAIFGNFILSLKKTLARKPRFTFRRPMLDSFQYPDDDAVFLANYADLKKWFQGRGLEVKYCQFKPDPAKITGRISSALLALFPWLDKGFCLIAHRGMPHPDEVIRNDALTL